jgi:putative ABC transport system substrate-binding protein
VWCSTVGCIVTLILSLLAAPHVADAQQRGKVPQLGWLAGRSRADATATPNIEAFLDGLREHGWIEGHTIAIAFRSPEGRVERYPDLVAELVRLPVDVLFTSGGDPAAWAAKHATSTLPIVMLSSDPVGTGLVASLARPGGNVTGLSIQAAEVGGKRLELLKDALPQASRVAVLWNAAAAGKASELQDTQVAAQALGVTLVSIEVRAPADLDRAFAAISRERPEALITFADPLTLTHQRRIVDFVTAHRLPMISEIKEFAVTGALMTYGVNLPALFRRAAYYVDRILRGTQPADLPVEQPTKFELIINLKAAKALGLSIPPTLLVQADAVIK